MSESTLGGGVARGVEFVCVCVCVEGEGWMDRGEVGSLDRKSVV